MSRAKVWYGYLEAGKKSTPVVRDESLQTGNPKMIYLFNLSKNTFLEYAAAVVESKLREFTPDEADIMLELKSAYTKARNAFQGRSERLGSSTGSTSSGGNNSSFMESNASDDNEPFLDDSDSWDDD